MNFLKRWTEEGKRARRLIRAENLRETGDLAAALAEYELALRDDPDNVRALQEVSELRALTGEPEAAVESLCALLERDLDEMRFIGNTAFDSIRSLPLFRPVFETVIARLRSHIDAHPTDVTAAFSLAEAFEMSDDPKSALAVYSDLGDNRDAAVRARAFYNRARLHALAGDVPSAAAQLRAAFEADSDLLYAFENDAAFDSVRDGTDVRSAYDAGIECVEEDLRRSIEREPTNPVPSQRLFNLLMRRGLWDEAVGAARDAVDRMPDEGAFYEAIGDALFAAGSDERAFDAYQDVLRRNPRHVGALVRSGVLYERRGQRIAALESYADALSENHREPDAALAVARGFARLNEQERALEALSQAIELTLDAGAETPAELLQAIERADDWGALSESDEFLRLIAELRDPYDADEETDPTSP